MEIEMTMPHLMNCPHSCDSWCLDCVKEIGEENLDLREVAFLFEKVLLEDGDPFRGDHWEYMRRIRRALRLEVKDSPQSTR